MKQNLSLIIVLAVAVLSFGNAFQFLPSEAKNFSDSIINEFSPQSENTFNLSGNTYASSKVVTPGNVIRYLIFTISDNQATIVGCRNTISGDFIIPSTLDGYPVTCIGNEAFLGYDKLTSVTIPDSVTSIGSSAFSGCTSLENISIGKGISSIGNGAFEGCTAIEKVFFMGSESKLGMILQPNNTCLLNAKEIIYHNYHEYDNWTVSIEPTCTEYGEKHHTCIICDEIEYNPILPTGEHIYENGKCIHCGVIAESPNNLDLNGDGEINSADIVIMKKALLGKLKEEEIAACNINGDSETNILDLIKLKKSIA